MARRLPALAFLACTLGGIATVRSHIHTDPDGQTVDWYPSDCCHDRDCRPVTRIETKFNMLWMTTSDGLTISVDPHQSRRPSRDNRWHLCVTSDDTDTPFVRCVFEPAGS
ncbi:MAG: hypothetical protein EKK41_19825 [Hyphomicrobiales bacterium]|nr:MAG: hypothetical protein EKK41_19825 [Hyphomicrobiales bacterium]